MAVPKNPAPPFKCNIFFRSTTADAGWSERYWIAKPTYDDAMVEAQTMAQQRRDMMCINYAVVYIRISNDNIKGDAVVFEIPVGNQKGTIDKLPMTPTDAALVRLLLQDQHHAMRFFHGLAIDQMDNAFNILPLVNNWAAALLTFMTELQNNCVEWSKDFNAMTYRNRGILGYTFGRVREHKVGRPFGLYRGRSAA
jgi:hypothetical protein